MLMAKASLEGLKSKINNKTVIIATPFCYQDERNVEYPYVYQRVMKEV